jgi:hypothetical protein
MTKRHRARIDHPLWEKLRAVDKVAARRFPAPDFVGRGLGAVGLILHSKPKRWDYWCTLKNVLTFASTGGNGVHFSFVVLEDEVTEQSPVVVTIPMAFDQPNFICGESLFDFLCLGVNRGYFALEQLPATERTLEVFSSSTWQPTDDFDWAVGYGVNEHQRKVLDYLANELELVPWKDVKRKFNRLQRQVLPLLEVPDKDE